jgi:hypothetical protein
VFLEKQTANQAPRPEPLSQFQRKGEKVMKTLISMFAVALALAFTGPVFAGDVTTAKTPADCAKAGGIWNVARNACEKM